MAEDGTTTFIFKANTKQAETSLDEFGDKVTGVAKKAGQALAAYLTYSAIKNGIESVTKAAMESERAILAFNSALSLAGKYSASSSASFQHFASTLERTTGVQDEVILKNAALLVSLGKLSDDGLERATKASLNLAKGMQVDVGTAFDVVTKATQGNVMALKRYGLQVSDADSNTTKFEKTLSFIESRFGGLAQGSVNTLEGVINKLHLGFEDIQESIGKTITRSPKLIAAISVIGDEIYDLSDSIAHSSGNLNGMIDSLFKIGSVITNWVIKPLEMLSNFIATGFSTIFTVVLATLAQLAPMLDRIFKTDYTESINQLGRVWAMATINLANDAANMDVSLSTTLDAALDRAKTKVDELADKMKTKLPAASEAATFGMARNWDNFFSGFKQGITEMSKDISMLGKQVAGTFVNGFGNAFASMGKAIVKGQNVLKAFGGVILATLGQMAVQMGQFYIAAGIATMFLNPAQGMGMIIAGGALATLGGVLMALGSGEGDTTPAATGSTSSGSITTGGTGDNQLFGTETAEADRAKAQTGVTVVVQGNIFDNRETGLQIANIINEAFDTNGTIIRAMA